MPTKTPRPPKPKVPVLAFRAVYKRKKLAERERKEAERKAAFLALAEEYPGRRDEIMAVYAKRPGELTTKTFEATLPLFGLLPEAEALERKRFYEMKQRQKLSRKK